MRQQQPWYRPDDSISFTFFCPCSITASKLLPCASRDPKKQRALGELFESLQSRAEGAESNGRVAEAGAAARQPQSLVWIMLYLAQHYDLQRRTGGLGLAAVFLTLLLRFLVWAMLCLRSTATC